MPYYVPGMGYYKNDPGLANKIWMDRVGAVYWPMDNTDFIPSTDGWVMGAGGRFNPYTGERGGRPLGTPPPPLPGGPAWNNGNLEQFPTISNGSYSFGFPAATGQNLPGVLHRSPFAPLVNQNHHTMPPIPGGGRWHPPRPPHFGA